jgi:UDP-N-acetylglucosamine diphosphorylase / glucose-1-phosphate thymidylyltransferase / UDP-N-acetylgalactosamine diphosphorylase / glucosamine-1-phosphate N-acetyltransferase / galactosamine-1-phosphate N-acetyltransferase
MKQAVILAAGEGQRLRPFTLNRPKAMLAIADKPILGFVVESLVAAGIRDIICVVGYRKEQVYDSLGNGEQFGAEITYITQDAQLGTAHALSLVRGKVAEEFLVLPGDNLIEKGTIAEFAQVKPPALLVKRVSTPTRYGVVDVERGEVKGILEKPKEAVSNLVNTGIYAFTREIFGFTENVLDIPDALNNKIAAGHILKAVETNGTWLDIVYPWDIITLNHAILNDVRVSIEGTIERGASLRGNVVIGRGTVIRSGSCIYGPAVIGEGCDIGPQVCVLPASSIGDNVVISSFTEVKNSVIGNDVNIGPGCIISDSVIGKGCAIKGRFTAAGGPTEVSINNETPAIEVGVMMGEDCKVGSNVTAQPGAIIGNGCEIQMTKTISGKLPDKSLVY